MSIFTTLNLFLEFGIQYLKLKIKNVTLDTLDKFDARIDKLDERRKKLRAAGDSASQAEADRLLNEIIEEKKKFKIYLDDLKSENKLDKPVETK